MKRTPNLFNVQLDREIASVVIRLNEFGYVTCLSCAGHTARGFIVFARGIDHAAIKSFLECQGLKNVVVKDIEAPPVAQWEGINEATEATFDAIGRRIWT